MLLTERPEPKGVRKRRGGWKAALPPPLPHRGGFECASILDELEGKLGELVFQRARDVLLWNVTPAQQRDSLFEPTPHRATGQLPTGPEEVRKAFRTLNRLVAHPHDASPSRRR
jgi:hypothetical protein